MANWREVSPDVWYGTRPLAHVSAADLQWLQDRARTSPRGRARLCAHPHPEAALHEMLICLTRTSYVRPHRHRKPESAHIIRGACDLVFFDEQGGVAEVLALSELARGNPFFVRIEEPLYHTYLLKTDFLLFHETTPGPLDRRLTEFAPWAPDEGEFAAEFLDQLRSCIERAS
jgi:cupin fold WbuC family metalloprotein